MTYGTRIKQAREDLRLTQEQLAEQLDVSRQAVSKWEADLSRPTREKLDRLSEILDIPPESWAEIDAEIEAANRPPDTSRPWKIAAAALAAMCLILAACLAVSLWPKANVDVPRPLEDPPSTENLPVVPVPEEPDAPTDPSTIYPDILPITLSRDFDFGDWPLGEYDPARVPFLDDLEELQENELAGFMFGDAANHGPGDTWCHLSIVKTNTRTDERGTAYSDVYLLYALPDENGDLAYQILFRMAEENHYVNTDPGAITVEPFFNVLGHDGFKVLITVGASGRWGFYLTQCPDGTPAMMTNTAGTSLEADVDEDGILEIVNSWKNDRVWDIIDTEEGLEGALIYTLSTHNKDFPGALANLCFDPEKGGFVLLGNQDAVLARYALQDGLIVRLPRRHRQPLIPYRKRRGPHRPRRFLYHYVPIKTMQSIPGTRIRRVSCTAANRCPVSTSMAKCLCQGKLSSAASVPTFSTAAVISVPSVRAKASTCSFAHSHRRSPDCMETRSLRRFPSRAKCFCTAVSSRPQG